MKTQMNPRVFWGASIIVALMLSSTVIAPGAAIVFASLTFIMLANGLRERLDVGSRH